MLSFFCSIIFVKLLFNSLSLDHNSSSPSFSFSTFLIHLSSLFSTAISCLHCHFFVFSLPFPFVFLPQPIFFHFQNCRQSRVSFTSHLRVVEVSFHSWRNSFRLIFCEYFFLSFQFLNFKWKLILSLMPRFLTKP